MSPAWDSFCGGAYAHRSPTLDSEALFNRYPVTLASQDNKKSRGLMPTPGLRRLFGVSTSSCRGCFHEDGRTMAVVGDTLYECDLVTNSATTIGTIADDGMPVGVEFLGRPFSEPDLLRVAYAFEQATHHRRLPPLTPTLGR